MRTVLGRATSGLGRLIHALGRSGGRVARCWGGVHFSERIAIGILALTLLAGPAAVIGYGRWVDRDVVTVKAVQWAYLPKTFYAKVGVPVRLKIISEDVVHGFAIEGLPVTIAELIPGKAEYVTFTPETPGTFYYHCTTYCGLSHATMFGQIIVTARR
jgi:heme/copper-type cytochrome/quinol oxidase subunit 2